MHNKERKIATSTIIIFFAVFVLATTVFTFLLNNTGISEGTITHTDKGEKLSDYFDELAIDETSEFYDAFTSGDRVNVLVVGINDNMTDTIMLASYDMKNQKVDIISVPRDTYYERPQYGSSPNGFYKINSIYHTEDIVSLAKAVSKLTCGMPINCYAMFDFAAVEKVMDVIGGVYVDMPFAYKYDDTTRGKELHIDIPAGRQLIDSSNVVGFLRFRHTNPKYARQGYKSFNTGDLQRIQVQQQFVKNVMSECLKTGNILDVAKVGLNYVKSDVTVDIAIKVAKKAMEGLSGDDISLHTLPGTDPYINEISFYVVNKEQTAELVKQVYGLIPPSATVPDSIRLIEIPEL